VLCAAQTHVQTGLKELANQTEQRKVVLCRLERLAVFIQRVQQRLKLSKVPELLLCPGTKVYTLLTLLQDLDRAPEHQDIAECYKASKTESKTQVLRRIIL